MTSSCRVTRTGMCAAALAVAIQSRNRTPHALGPGDPVVFAPNCRRPGASPQLGGVWPAWDRLEAATYADGDFEPGGELAAGHTSTGWEGSARVLLRAQVPVP